MDENGIVWVTNAGLLRYDPFSRTHKIIHTSGLGIDSPTGLISDGNLYWTSNATAMVPHNLNMFPVDEKAASLIAKAPLDTAQRLIYALPDKITKDDKAAIEAARKAYDKLTDEQKMQVTNVEKLIAAEQAYAKLPTFNMTILYVAIAAVVVLAGGAVAVVIVLKKKKKNAPDAE